MGWVEWRNMPRAARGSAVRAGSVYADGSSAGAAACGSRPLVESLAR